MPASASIRARVAADARTIVRLGGPLLANNLAVAGMSFADTIMAGRLGAVDLAGLAVGASYFNLFLFMGLGVFMAVSPTVAHAHGADDAPRVASVLRQCWWLVALLAVPIVTGMWQAGLVLPAIGIAPEILPVATGYVKAVSFGMPALLAFFALRFTSEGLGHTRPIMYMAALGLVLNVCGNWVFMYGKLGMPSLGAVGCGVATAIAIWAMFLAMLLYVRAHRVYRPFRFFERFERPNRAIFWELLRLGVPIAGSVLAEGGLFVAAALLMGVMGATIAGAHQIALNYASFMFMVPLAMSSATTIHVGHLLGRGEARAARFAGLVGMGLCATVMAVSASAILLLNEQIAALYTKDPQVLELAGTLLLMAALFQFSDGVQVGAAGALRGFKDTTVPMVICLISYWVIGFSLAYVFGVLQGRGPVYVWLGLTAGLTAAAALLLTRYRVTSARAVRAREAGRATAVAPDGVPGA